MTYEESILAVVEREWDFQIYPSGDFMVVDVSGRQSSASGLASRKYVRKDAVAKEPFLLEATVSECVGQMLSHIDSQAGANI